MRNLYLGKLFFAYINLLASQGGVLWPLVSFIISLLGYNNATFNRSGPIYMYPEVINNHDRRGGESKKVLSTID